MAQASQRVDVDGHLMKLSHLDKPMYPDGTTKAAILDYYARIATVALAHVGDRILTRYRYPHGTAENGFFEKRAPPATPEWVRTVEVFSKTHGKNVTYIVADRLASLVWAVNHSTIELHVPQWRLATAPVRQRRCPDRLVIDLDPGEGAGMAECVHIAQMVRERLTADGLSVHPKVSGRNGLHLVAPISPVVPDTHVTAYAKRLAQDLAAQWPRLVTATMGKRNRAGGKVLIDWSQNNAGKTTVAAYSLRAGHSPAVSAPVTWDELGNGGFGPFGPQEVVDRVAARGDPHHGTLLPGPKLPAH